MKTEKSKNTVKKTVKTPEKNNVKKPAVKKTAAKKPAAKGKPVKKNVISKLDKDYLKNSAPPDPVYTFRTHPAPAEPVTETAPPEPVTETAPPEPVTETAPPEINAENLFKDRLKEFQEKSEAQNNETEKEPVLNVTDSEKMNLLPLEQQLIMLDGMICLALTMFSKKKIEPMKPAEAKFLADMSGGEVKSILPTGKMMFYGCLAFYYISKLK